METWHAGEHLNFFYFFICVCLYSDAAPFPVQCYDIHWPSGRWRINSHDCLCTCRFWEQIATANFSPYSAMCFTVTLLLVSVVLSLLFVVFSTSEVGFWSIRSIDYDSPWTHVSLPGSEILEDCIEKYILQGGSDICSLSKWNPKKKNPFTFQFYVLKGKESIAFF